MLGSHRPLCNATRRLLGQRRSLPPTARVVCTSTANCRDISTKPPQKYASLAPHPVHSAASSFSPSLPYPHPPPPPAAYPSPFPQPHDVDRQPQTTAEPAGGQTFYRRELPKHLHSFTSKSGRALFKECVASGNAEIYFSLSGNFTTQSEPAFCGLGSLAMVLNALTVDPGRRWKGVWRWYSDDMLECTHTPREQIREKGMTFAELACLARCNGLRVVSRRADTVSRETFLADLKRVSASEDMHMVVSFSRKTLGQTGDGHFSPIGAYHPGKNQALVLDTARFKYPSYFCDADLLYDAMGELDAVTGLPRGYFILTKGAAKPLSLCRISVADLGGHDWSRLARLFAHDVPDAALRMFQPPAVGDSDDSTDAVPAVLRHILAALPTTSPFIISLQPPGVDLASATQSLATHHAEDVVALLTAARATPLYAHVVAALAHPELERAFPTSLTSSPQAAAEGPDTRAVTAALATIYVLAAPGRMFGGLSKPVRAAFEELRARHGLTPLLAGEVERISDQLEILVNSFGRERCECGAGPAHHKH